jgi:hypothetical protein
MKTSDDWHTTQSSVDLRKSGKFSSWMKAKASRRGLIHVPSGGFRFVVPVPKLEPSPHVY